MQKQMKNVRKTKQVVLILGMHRSGTSAATKALVSMGYNPGQRLMPAHPENLKGFWEDIEWTELNDHLLYECGTSWDQIFNESISSIRLKNINGDFVQRAKRLLKKRFDENDRVVIKDPRMCVLAPFWQKVFDEFDCDLKLIHILRNPLEVARSLNERDGIPENNGMLLWMHYNLSIIRNSKSDCLLIDFPDLLNNPRHEISRISEYLGVDLEEFEYEIEDYCNDFLESGLKHYAADTSQLKEATHFFPEIYKLYSELELLSNNSICRHKVMSSLAAKFPCSLSLYMEDAFSCLPNKHQFQLYLDFGNGFSEEVSLSHILGSNLGVAVFDLTRFGPIKKIRLDPGTRKCVIRINSFKAVHLNEMETELEYSGNYSLDDNGLLIFDTHDPQLFVEFNKPLNSVRLSYELLGFEEAVNAYVLPETKKRLSAVSHELVRQDQLVAEKERVLESQSEKLNTFQAQVETSLLEAQKLQQQIDEKENSLTDLHQQLNTFQDSINVLNQSLSDKDTKISEQSSAIQHKEKEINDLRSRFVSLEDALKEHKHQSDESRQLLKEKAKELNELQHTHESVQLQKNALQEQLKQFENQLNASTVATAEKEKALVSTRHELSILEASITELSEELEQKNQKISEKEKSIQHKKNEINDLRSRFVSLEDTLKEHKHQSDENRQLLQEKVKELNELQHAHESVQLQKNALQEQLEQQRLEISSLEASFDGLTNEVSEKERSLQLQNDELASVQIKLEQVRSQLNSSNQSVVKKTSELHTKEQDLIKAKNKLDFLQSSVNQLHKEVNVKELELTEKEKLIAYKEKELAVFKQKSSKNEKLLKDSEKENKYLHQKISNSENRYKGLENNYKGLLVQLDLTEKKIFSIEEEKNNLVQQNKELNKKHRFLLDENKKSAQLEKQTLGLQKKLSDCRTSLSSSESELKIKINELSQVKEQLQRSEDDKRNMNIEQENILKKLQNQQSMKMFFHDQMQAEKFRKELLAESVSTQNMKVRIKQKIRKFCGSFLHINRTREYKKQYKIISDSGIFDTSFYYSEYPDVLNYPGDALEHYIEHGWKELREPYKGFNDDIYNIGMTKFSNKNPFIELNKDEFLVLRKKKSEREKNRLKTSYKEIISVEKKYPGITKPVGIGIANNLIKKIREIPYKVHTIKKRTIHFILPCFDPDIMFGGYISALHFIRRLVEFGENVSVIVIEDNFFDRDIALGKLKNKKNILKCLQKVSFIDLKKCKGKICFGSNDRFIAYSAWQAFHAYNFSQKTNFPYFYYFIQEFEPIFHENSSIRAIVENSYELPSVSLFNTKYLMNYFKNKKIGCFSEYAEKNWAERNYYYFEHAITDISPPVLHKLQEKRKRKLLFYARPESHAKRNMFEIGIMTLREAIRNNIFSNDWEFHGIGSLINTYEIDLGKGKKLYIKPKIDQNKYEDALKEYDIGMSFMHAPHPSILPFEMAKTGMVVLTNAYDYRNQDFYDKISKNILCADAKIECLVEKLQEAVIKSYDYESRINNSKIRWNNSWDNAFSDNLISNILGLK